MADTTIKALASSVVYKDRPLKILTVDDEPINLEILEKHLTKAGYQVITLESGMRAWSFLSQRTEAVDIILLDKMMPGMDGMELLKKIKAEKDFKDIPVIMQTAAANKEDMVAGIEAGAYYYITKPYAAEMLVSVVKSAGQECKQRDALKAALKKNHEVLDLQVSATYEFRTLEDGRKVAVYLSQFAQEPNRIAVALSALIENAVEHGNLELGYNKKAELVASGDLERELAYRMVLPQFSERKVSVSYQKQPAVMKVIIRDQGPGFKWKDFTDFDPRRLTDPNGRGIAMATIMNPGAVSYNDAGNEVTFTISLNKP